MYDLKKSSGVIIMLLEVVMNAFRSVLSQDYESIFLKPMKGLRLLGFQLWLIWHRYPILQRGVKNSSRLCINMLLLIKWMQQIEMLC